MSFIELKDVSLSYPVYGVNARSIKSSLLNFATGGIINRKQGAVSVQALSGINLRLERGDRLGLVGSNGAGKTSLLKVLAGIYEPTQGSVTVSGRTHCLFDIMVGLDQALTGYENIMLRGYLFGLSKKEICEAIPSIEAFTELGEFIKMPLKSYSAGMLVRLAFGIITSFPSEILLVDEVMGVGDAQFIKKAQMRMENLVHRSEIMVLSTHDHSLIKKFCTKVLCLEQGKIKFLWSVKEKLDEHLEFEQIGLSN